MPEWFNEFQLLHFQTAKPSITVGINPVLSDLNTPQTSKLGLRYFEANKIDRNELQIRKNLQKGTGTKMSEKLNNFEKFERKKKSNFNQPDLNPILNPETSWWLVANKYTKFGKNKWKFVT